MDIPEPKSTDAPVSAASLVEQLIDVDGYPEPRLMAQILALGSEAVEPLRALVRRECKEWYEFGAVGFACEILGSLGEQSAIPDMLGLFRRVDDEVLEEVGPVLGDFGLQVLDQTLEIGRDKSLPWYPRSLAFSAAMRAAGADPAARTKVAQPLREMLADLVRSGEEAIARAEARASAKAEAKANAEAEAKANASAAPDVSDDKADVDELDDEDGDDLDDEDGDELGDEDGDELGDEDGDDEDEEDDDYGDEGIETDFYEKITILVADLAQLADPLAGDLIETAFKLDFVDTWLYSKASIDACYRKGGQTSEPREPFLVRYEARYNEHKQREREREQYKRQQANKKASTPLPPPSPAAKKVMTKPTAQPGRNDRCWCGSGKKYKQCHLRRDQE